MYHDVSTTNRGLCHKSSRSLERYSQGIQPNIPRSINSRQCIYIHISFKYRYLSIYIHIYLFLFRFRYTFTFIYTYMHTCTYIHMYIHICIYEYTYGSRVLGCEHPLSTNKRCSIPIYQSGCCL